MFEGTVVRSVAQIAACQAIRFRVYCRERRFLREVDYPEETERDEFDEHAIHIAVIGQSGNVLGTARIIRHSDRGFPLARYCHAEIPESLLPTTGEVSRLAVPRSTASDLWTDHFSREVAFRLYQTVYRVGKQAGLTHLTAVMERSLVRILRRFDITWSPIGPAVDYGGLVRPYLFSMAAFDAVDSAAANRFREADLLESTPYGAISKPFFVLNDVSGASRLRPPERPVA